MKYLGAVIAVLLFLGTGTQTWAALTDPVIPDLQGNIALSNQSGASPTITAQQLNVAPLGADMGQLIRPDLSAMAPGPGQIKLLNNSPMSLLSLAALAGVVKPAHGFFLDNPDDPSAGITLSLTSSAPLPIVVMDTTPTPTPLPPAFLLFGSGLVGLAATKLRTRLS